MPYTVDTTISEVVNDPVFGDYGRLLFPVDRGYCSGDTLGDLRLTWYSDIDPDETVEIANSLRSVRWQARRCFTIYTPMRKKRMTPKRKTQGCFSSRKGGSAFRRMQRRRRVRICRRDAGQLPARAGTFEERVQCLRFDIQAGRSDSL